MSKLFNNAVYLAFLFALILATAFLIVKNTMVAKASVDNDTSGYMSTSTPKALNYAAGSVLLKGTSTRSTYGILGTVAFTGAPKGARITLYDATTTDVTKRTGGLATSSIILAEFDAGQATSSVYVLDIAFSNGLLLESSGNPATSTITFK